MQVQFRSGLKHNVEREESEYYILTHHPNNWSADYRIAVKKSAVAVVVEKTYKIGQRFHIYGETEYILAAVGDRLVTFISLKAGDRWADPIKVGDPGAITSNELDRLAARHELICDCN